MPKCLKKKKKSIPNLCAGTLPLAVPPAIQHQFTAEPHLHIACPSSSPIATVVGNGTECMKCKLRVGLTCVGTGKMESTEVSFRHYSLLGTIGHLTITGYICLIPETRSTTSLYYAILRMPDARVVQRMKGEQILAPIRANTSAAGTKQQQQMRRGSGGNKPDISR